MDRNYTSCNRPDLWGGVECTINRIADRFHDQLEVSGHYERPDDMAQLAALGFKKMRYPILWERHEPVKDQEIDWDPTARKLEQLRERGVEPIAGLVHHGSGPAFTSLSDPDFPSLLADYAFRVSSRFPFLKDFTPVNEPLTTARFSGLYGLWHPHHRDDASFARMLLNELKGTVLSMQAIRSVNPGARLIQTEDLGKTHGTRGLQEHISFENHRRWLTYDILCGRFTAGHPLWNWFLHRAAVDEKDLWFFIDNPTPPDVLGLNYYVTSERWLDEDLSRYPPVTHGGSRFHRFADTEVVRVRPELRHGVGRLAREVWDRYHIPLALTEVHLHCTREEQMRWFAESWQEAEKLCQTGVPVEGVTAWSLLGAYDWDSLLTRADKHYEPGVFVVSGKNVRRTALARLITEMSEKGISTHPLLKSKGWWHGEQNMLPDPDAPRLLIAGPGGEIAETLRRACRDRGIACLQQTHHAPHQTLHHTLHNTLHHAPPSPREKGFPGSKSGQEYWDILGYNDAPHLEFFNARFSVCAREGIALVPLIHQVLDLLIDEVEGQWDYDEQNGTPLLRQRSKAAHAMSLTAF